MSSTLETEIAERLRNAEARAQPIEPFAHSLGANGIERAYRIQHINTAHGIAAGRKFCGRKIGLTAKTVQQQLGVDQPDYGALFEDMRLPSGGMLDLAPLIDPRIEAEIALVLGKGIAEQGMSPRDLAACVRYATPALEIVDSRLKDWKIGFADTIADNGASARFVLGEQCHDIQGLDLTAGRMELRRNGALVSSGQGSSTMGGPVHALAWLAETLITHGRPLQAGDVVLTGALGPVVPLAPGDVFQASIDQLSSVSLSIR